MIQNRMLSFAPATVIALTLVFLVLGPLGAQPALAHSTPPNCQTNLVNVGTDPNCEGHWQNSHMLWHWGTEIGHHSGLKDRFESALGNWENGCCPNGQWHTHYDTAAATHANTVDVDPNSGTLGKGSPAVTDVWDHIPKMNDLWVRHNMGTPGVDYTTWWTQVGEDVPCDKVDAWSVWQEETGHAANISHNGNGTMSGTTYPCDTSKRDPSDHQFWHAQEIYDRVHATGMPADQPDGWP